MEGGLDLHQVEQSQLDSGWTSKLFDGEGGPMQGGVVLVTLVPNEISKLFGVKLNRPD